MAQVKQLQEPPKNRTWEQEKERVGKMVSIMNRYGDEVINNFDHIYSVYLLHVEMVKNQQEKN